MPATLATFKRAGATRALVMVSGPNGWRMTPAQLGLVVDAFHKRAIEAVTVAFPPVNGDHVSSRAHYRACRCIANGGQLDAEPKQIGRTPAGKPIMAHWSVPLLQPWLDDDASMSITSTRVELVRLGKHGRRFYEQLEQQTSFDTLEKAVDIADDFVPRSAIVLVQGSFNQPNDPRTLAEFVHDRDRARAQATLVEEHACWSAHTLDGPKADALRALAA
jgi:hypothetical protein